MKYPNCKISFIQTLPDQESCYVCELIESCKNFPTGDPDIIFFNSDKNKFGGRRSTSWERGNDTKSP